MKLAVFGSKDRLVEALDGLKLSPEEIHVAAELDQNACIENVCTPRKITLKKYGVNWSDIDVPGADIGENKFGKYNKRAPLVRNDIMLNAVSHVLLLGDDKYNGSTERSVSYLQRKGAKIDLLKWPCQTKVTSSAPQSSDIPPDEDIPF